MINNTGATPCQVCVHEKNTCILKLKKQSPASPCDDHRAKKPASQSEIGIKKHTDGQRSTVFYDLPLRGVTFDDLSV